MYGLHHPGLALTSPETLKYSELNDRSPIKVEIHLFIFLFSQIFHYYIKNIFAPRTIIAQIHYEYIYLYATRDTLGDPEEMIATLGVYRLSSFEADVTMSWNVTMVSIKYKVNPFFKFV